MYKSRYGMGFRKLHDFNVVMLGKHGWKLLTNPLSLVARIFKARYFPKSSFLKVEMGTNPSFVWCSIMASQNLLKKGARWRIGRGNQVRIYRDP